jgi:hypothetical protein
MPEKNTMLHSILDIISKLIKWPWWIPQNDSWFDPLHRLLKIRKWGIFSKGQGGQMEKNKEKIIYIAKKSPRWNTHLIEKEIKD